MKTKAATNTKATKKRRYHDYIKEVSRWKQTSFSYKTVSIALREYLERRGYTVNPKRGVEYDYRDAWVFVEK